MVALPGGAAPPGMVHGPGADEADDRLGQILARIFSNDRFRRAEAAWRGLKLLLSSRGRREQIRVEIVPADLETLDETLHRLSAGLMGSAPSLVIVDLPFDQTPRCIDLLEKISLFSEMLIAPSIAWITPRFFRVESWPDLKKLPSPPRRLEEPPFAKWQKVKRRPPGRWLAVACNRFLIRYPYGPDNNPRKARFEERRPPWISPVWALGSLWIQSVERFGWPTRFTQWRELRVEDLPLAAHDGGRPLSTEAFFSRERIDQFIRAGVTPLASPYNRDFAFTPRETTIGRGSLRYQSFVARVTHFVLWCKDHFEEDLTASELKARLQSALALFWERSGHPAPDDLEIAADPPNSRNRIHIRVLVKPSREILTSSEPLELEMEW